MVLYQAKDYKDMSRKSANIISAQVIIGTQVQFVADEFKKLCK